LEIKIDERRSNMTNDNSKIGQRLLQLKKQIEDEKAKQSELKGELKSIMKQLQDEFNVQSLDEASESLESMQEDLEKYRETIQEKLEKAKELFEGGE